MYSYVSLRWREKEINFYIADITENYAEWIDTIAFQDETEKNTNFSSLADCLDERLKLFIVVRLKKKHLLKKMSRNKIRK